MNHERPQSSIGEQELALLRHIADRGSVTVAEAVEQFGAARELARSTVLTMMERLRRKGHLARRLVDGLYRYRARTTSAELMKGAVQRFVERNLDGSVSPFLAYLSEAGQVSDAELRELEEIVARLNAGKKIGAMMLEILVRASVEGAILVAAIWAICRFLPRLSPATRTVLWWCAAAKFVLALVWTAPVLVPILPAATPGRFSSAVSCTATPRGAAAQANRCRQSSERRPGSQSRIPAFAREPTERYGVARLVALVGRVDAGSRRGRERRRTAMEADGRTRRTIAGSPPEVEATAAALASRLGLRRVPSVRVSDEVGTPLVTGILRPVILLPTPAFDALSDRQQRMALCHELTHIKRADLWLGCVPAIAERAFFFHPLVHFAAREYALCREAACDAQVLAVLEAAPQEYGRLLLGLGVSRTRTNLAAAGAPWSFSTLRRRIAMLDSPTPRSTGSRVVAAAVIGIAALAIAPLRIAARPAAVDPKIEQAVQPPAADGNVRLDPTTSPDLAPASAPQGDRDLNYIIFLDDDHTTMSGSTDDIQRARRYRQPGEPMLWFRNGGREYVDPRSEDPRRRDRVVETGERARRSTRRSGWQAGRARREAG